MNMIRHPIDGDWRCLKIADDAAQVGMKLLLDPAMDQCHPILGRKHDVPVYLVQ